MRCHPRCFAFARCLLPWQTKDCPWALSKAEKRLHNRDPSIQGNIIRMKSQAPGTLISPWSNRTSFIVIASCLEGSK